MLLGEDGAQFTNSASVVKVKIANISSFSFLLMEWENNNKKKGISEMSTWEDFALSKSMQFWGCLFPLFFSWFC